MTTLELPPRDVNGFSQPLVRLTLKTKRELWLANEYAAIKDALDAGQPFEAHMIVGLKPVPVVITPAHVALVEDNR
jgi:hypothetical protein